MSDKIELLPCPFCGGEAEYDEIPAGALVQCSCCGVELRNGSVGVGWYESRALAAADWNHRAGAQQPAPVAVPEECPHMIVFDDTDREPLVFAGTGARNAALRAWKQISNSWNAHLFVRIERNCRDDRYPSAMLAAAPTAPVAVQEGWIPMTNQQPAVGQYVVLAGPQCADHPGRYWRMTGVRREDGYYDSNSCTADDATHWIALPDVVSSAAPPAAEQPSVLAMADLLPDEIHQMAFEEGQPAENGDGYLFTAEEFDIFVDRLLNRASQAEQPDTVKVSRELLERACTKRSAPGGYRVAMDAIVELRALLTGGEA